MPKIKKEDVDGNGAAAAAASASGKGSNIKLGERESKLLGNLMQHLLNGEEGGVSFRQCSKDMDFMERTKTYRTSWTTLIDEGCIEASDSGGGAVYTGNYKLTQKGKDYATTPEYKEYLKDLAFVPKTNEEHHERIKKRLKWQKYGSMIIDLLLEHGALTRKELAAICGIVDRSHAFSYAIQELNTEKGKGYIERLSNCKEFVLTPKSFVAGSMPNPRVLPDPDKIQALINEMAKDKPAKKDGGSNKKRKKQRSNTDDGEENDGVEEADSSSSPETKSKKQKKTKKEATKKKSKEDEAIETSEREKRMTVKKGTKKDKGVNVKDEEEDERQWDIGDDVEQEEEEGRDGDGDGEGVGIQKQIKTELK